MDDDDANDIFAIEISSSDESTTTQKKVPRDFLSEADFQKLLSSYKPKIEDGNLYKEVEGMIAENNGPPSKQDQQLILHAIEELYFYGRFEHARRIVDEALRGGEGPDEWRKLLKDYGERCSKKVKG